MALESALEGGGGRGEDAGDGMGDASLAKGSGRGNTREGGMGGGEADTRKSGGISIVRDKVYCRSDILASSFREPLRKRSHIASWLL